MSVNPQKNFRLRGSREISSYLSEKEHEGNDGEEDDINFSDLDMRMEKRNAFSNSKLMLIIEPGVG